MKGTRPLDNSKIRRVSAIVPSNEKSDLPNFRLSDTLYKSSLGGIATRR